MRYQRTIDYCSALAARPAPPSSLIHQWSRQARPRIPAQCSAAVPHLPPGLYSSYWDRGSIVRQGRTSGLPGVCRAGVPSRWPGVTSSVLSSLCPALTVDLVISATLFSFSARVGSSAVQISQSTQHHTPVCWDSSNLASPLPAWQSNARPAALHLPAPHSSGSNRNYLLVAHRAHRLMVRR